MKCWSSGRGGFLVTSTAREIARRIVAADPATVAEVDSIVRSSARELRVKIPRRSELLEAVRLCPGAQAPLTRLLRTNPVRSRSGVAVVAVIMKDHPCPGSCLFCPREEGIAQSYLGEEPAVARALENDFDPERQTAARLAALAATGHATDKVEAIILGGSFGAYPGPYRRDFVDGMLAALNGPGVAHNSAAAQRLIGLTVETRPDMVDLEELVFLRELGVTKVELGVQSLDEGVLEANRRGHGKDEVRYAVRLLRDAGFKVGFHLMPGLPGSDLECDGRTLAETFREPAYRPDYLKIYPCVVVDGSPLVEVWRRGVYVPPTASELVGLLAKAKAALPPYVRLSRLVRDIPAGRILAGITEGNLRERIGERMRAEGLLCGCIRCREVGEGSISAATPVEPTDYAYETVGGEEHFLSVEDPNGGLLSFARLRLPSGVSTALRAFPELDGAALLRELRTYGEAAPLGIEGRVQHRGLGEALLRRAEQLARRSGYARLAIITAPGIEPYYLRRGYLRTGSYLLKELG